VTTLSRDIIYVAADGTQTIETVDMDLFGNGTLASRPVSGTVAGDIYIIFDATKGQYVWNIWDGTAWDVIVDRKSNLSATTNPTVNDDSDDGYEVGSLWVNTSTGSVYICVDATVGAAVWTNLTAGGGSDELVKVSADDTTADYLINKLTSGTTAATWTEVNPGGDEDLELNIGNATNLIDGLMNLTDKAFANHGFDTSWSEGGVLTYGTGLDVDVAAGGGFVNDATDETSGTTAVSWTADTITLAPNTDTWIYVTSGGVVSTATSFPDTNSNVLLGRARGNATQGTFLAADVVGLQQHRASFHGFVSEAFGGLATDGLTATENGTTPLHLDVGSGTFYIGGVKKTHTSATDISWTYWYQDGAGGWTTVPGSSAVDSTYYDDGSGTLATIPTNKWKKDILFITENGSGSEFHMVYAQEVYTFQAAAETGNLPTPPDELLRDAARFAGLIVQHTSSSIISIVDEKPLTGQREEASAAPTVVRSVAFQLQSNGSPSVSGEHVVFSVASNGSANFAFSIPENYVAMVALGLVGVPSSGAAGAGRDIDLFSEYGDPSTNESPSAHAESDTTTTYDFTGLSGLFTSVDLTPVFSSVEGGDRCGFNVKHNSIGGAMEYHEIRLVYEASV